jgi:hypothetical protein
MNISFINTNQLQIDWELHEQLLAVNFQPQFLIPYDHITSISTAEPVSSWTEIKSPGITLPGIIKAGTYYSNRGKEFWYVTKDKNYLTLELINEQWQRIIISIDDNQTWAEQINQRLSINEYPSPQDN